MKNLRFGLALALLCLAFGDSPAQRQSVAPACSQSTFAAFRALPKMEYECPEDVTVSDSKILKLPQRIASIRKLVRTLEGFTNAAWWNATVDELNACSIHHEAGRLTDEETDTWKRGDYSFDLFGNHQMRLVVISDPCYQQGYSGSNAFLLYRKAGRVFVSELLNGYYSRIENSVGVDFAVSSGRQLIEVSTANNMPPSVRNYYFEIDQATNKARPRNLFRERGKPTNQIYSDMLMVDPSDVGLPKDASELNVFRNGRLAQSFSAYDQNEKGEIDANDRKLSRIIYRWNGRFYVPR